MDISHFQTALGKDIKGTIETSNDFIKDQVQVVSDALSSTKHKVKIETETEAPDAVTETIDDDDEAIDFTNKTTNTVEQASNDVKISIKNVAVELLNKTEHFQSVLKIFASEVKDFTDFILRQTDGDVLNMAKSVLDRKNENKTADIS